MNGNNLSAEQQNQIFVVQNKKKNTLECVKNETDNDGKTITSPYNEKFHNGFLFDLNGDIFTNFLRNLVSQFKNPTDYAIYSIPEEAAKMLNKILVIKNPKKQTNELIRIGKPLNVNKIITNQTQDNPPQKSPENDTVKQTGTLASETAQDSEQANTINSVNTDPVEVKVHPLEPETRATETTQNSEQANTINSVNTAPIEVKVQPLEPETSTKETTQEVEKKTPPFPLEKFKWDEFEKINVSKNFLMESGSLDSLQYGGFTPFLVNCRFETTGGMKVDATGRLRVVYNQNGEVVPKILGINREVNLDTPYRGYKFTENDILNLQSRSGNLGHPVDLEFSQDGKKTKCFLTLDHKTNQFVPRAFRDLHIPEQFFNVKLSKKEHNTLKSGGKIYRKDWYSQKTNRTYPGFAQYNTISNGIQITFDEYKQSKTVELKNPKEKQEAENTQHKPEKKNIQKKKTGIKP